MLRESAKAAISAPKSICMPTARIPLPLDVAERGDADGADDRTDAERREQDAVALGVAVEDVFREDREERDERHRAEAADERQDDEAAKRSRVLDRPKPGLQAREDALGRRRDHSASLQHQEGRDRREERQGVQAEARRGAQLVERDAGEHRPDDAREVELDGVQGDGVRQSPPCRPASAPAPDRPALRTIARGPRRRTGSGSSRPAPRARGAERRAASRSPSARTASAEGCAAGPRGPP